MYRHCCLYLGGTEWPIAANVVEWFFLQAVLLTASADKAHRDWLCSVYSADDESFEHNVAKKNLAMLLFLHYLFGSSANLNNKC